jgi:hypothetical protein
MFYTIKQPSKQEEQIKLEYTPRKKRLIELYELYGCEYILQPEDYRYIHFARLVKERSDTHRLKAQYRMPMRI